MKALERAMNYLSHRPRTGKEVKDYLYKKGYDDDDIHNAVAHLYSKGYLDDTKYAYMYTRYMIGKRRSMGRIKYDLKKLGVSEDCIDDGIYMYEDDVNRPLYEIEYENALFEAEKILHKVKKTDYTCEESSEYERLKEERKINDKIARRLSSLGYSSSIVFKIIEVVRKKEL